MSSRTVAICILLVISMTVIPQVEAQAPPLFPQEIIMYNPWIEPPFLYPSLNTTSQVEELTFERPEPGSGSVITIDPGENSTLSIRNVSDRFYNPDIDPYFSLDTGWAVIFGFPHLNCTLRFDGDGNGVFEYSIDFEFEDTEDFSVGVEPSSTNGNPLNMTGGTIELDIARTDGGALDFDIFCTNSPILIPFDIDTDGDGVTDFTDEDNDNDGYMDEDDEFPWDPDEWKDSEGP